MWGKVICFFKIIRAGHDKPVFMAHVQFFEEIGKAKWQPTEENMLIPSSTLKNVIFHSLRRGHKSLS